MGSVRGLRFIVMGLAAALCSMTYATTAPAYFDSGGGTTLSTMIDRGAIVLSYADYQPAFDLKVLAEHRLTASDYPAFRPMPVKERASRSAVRPTALSGWRSGRVRTLAG